MLSLVLFTAACVGPRIVGENPYNWFPEGVDQHQQNWLGQQDPKTGQLLRLDFERFPVGEDSHDYSYNSFVVKGVATYAIDDKQNINIPILVTTSSLVNSDSTVWMFAVRVVNGKRVAVQVYPPIGTTFK